MGAAREKDQADFDLERFIDMFDEALTSRDERVINALRSLMMMTILTKSETYNSGLHDRNSGPLRRMYEDLHHITRRINDLEENLRREAAYESERVKGTVWPKYYEEQDKYRLAAASQNLAEQQIKTLMPRVPVGINKISK